MRVTLDRLAEERRSSARTGHRTDGNTIEGVGILVGQRRRCKRAQAAGNASTLIIEQMALVASASARSHNRFITLREGGTPRNSNENFLLQITEPNLDPGSRSAFLNSPRPLHHHKRHPPGYLRISFSSNVFFEKERLKNSRYQPVISHHRLLKF